MSYKECLSISNKTYFSYIMSITLQMNKNVTLTYLHETDQEADTHHMLV
jgi:hypothetical protein